MYPRMTPDAEKECGTAVVDAIAISHSNDVLAISRMCLSLYTSTAIGNNDRPLLEPANLRAICESFPMKIFSLAKDSHYTVAIIGL